MKFNTEKLMIDLQAAGIVYGSCNSNGIVCDIDGMTQIQTRADVAAVLAAHDSAIYEQLLLSRKARRDNAQGEAALATQLKSVTPQQAVDYIEANVTNLASAKAVLRIMARMLIALRDAQFPDLPEE